MSNIQLKHIQNSVRSLLWPTILYIQQTCGQLLKLKCRGSMKMFTTLLMLRVLCIKETIWFGSLFVTKVLVNTAAPAEQFEGHYHSFMDADFILHKFRALTWNSPVEKNLGICKKASSTVFITNWHIASLPTANCQGKGSVDHHF